MKVLSSKVLVESNAFFNHLLTQTYPAQWNWTGCQLYLSCAQSWSAYTYFLYCLPVPIIRGDISASDNQVPLMLSMIQAITDRVPSHCLRLLTFGPEVEWIKILSWFSASIFLKLNPPPYSRTLKQKAARDSFIAFLEVSQFVKFRCWWQFSSSHSFCDWAIIKVPACTFTQVPSLLCIQGQLVGLCYLHLHPYLILLRDSKNSLTNDNNWLSFTLHPVSWKK